MGKGNAAVRQWMGNPERFADLFNGMVFDGEQVIRPEEVEPGMSVGSPGMRESGKSALCYVCPKYAIR